ncbi:elements of external origin [Ralstonia solanacearum]|nr:elements of external origin [Ralstonia solanacearum]RAA04400.1 elements of external origin [Ralstonia pseudosolanacearum]AXV74636.1 elements of external origin [Ralstonia solanacearum]AXV97545.1 elements of external origin [Ralstonia solanacearum]AXW02723.1 elements of external origin [Ralstonia solanacearum]
MFDLAVDTPQCWDAQRRRIDEVVVKAREGKTRTAALT